MVTRLPGVHRAVTKGALAASVVLALSAAPSPSYADNIDDGARREAVVAAIAYNFARFIQWRNLSDEEAQSNLVFCVMDENASTAWSGIEGKAVGERKIELLFADQVAASGRQCDIAYLSEHSQKAVSLEEMAESGVVTISDAETFIRNGGAIALSVSEKGASFEIDEQTLRRAGARVSSKLMRVGMRVSLSK